jgi:hypothetical protein
MRDESVTMPALFSQAQALTSLGSTPLVVLTRPRRRTRRVGRRPRTGWPRYRPTASHRDADATHAGLLCEERGADISARAIDDDVVQAARTGASLPAS